MSEFEPAVKELLEQEGGLIDNATDPGQITNWGVSYRFYKSIFPEAMSDDIKNLTKLQAIDIYKKYFWDECKFSLFNSQIIANMAFDMFVNMGLAPSVKILQRASRAVMANKDAIADDGVLGEQTLNLLNNLSVIDLSIAIRAERAGYYREIVLHNSVLKPNLEGWLNRAYRV